MKSLKPFLILNKNIFLFYIFIINFSIPLTAQKTESDSLYHSKCNTIGIKSFIIPVALISFGAININSQFNVNVQNKIVPKDPNSKCHLDNYLQYTPAVLALGLNAVGIKGKHSLGQTALIYAMANIISNSIVYPAKHFTHEMRPDGSDDFSFPSGHTTEAFVSAELLRMEFKEVSPWYGISGYLMAFSTGYLRMYNNKHWISDVTAGAGIGIASTKLAYLIYNKWSPKLKSKKHLVHNIILLPSYQNKQPGFCLINRF